MTTNDKVPIRKIKGKKSDADTTEGRQIKPPRGGGKSWRTLIEQED